MCGYVGNVTYATHNPGFTETVVSGKHRVRVKQGLYTVTIPVLPYLWFLENTEEVKPGLFPDHSMMQEYHAMVHQPVDVYWSVVHVALGWLSGALDRWYSGCVRF